MSAGERNAEHAQQVAILGFGLDKGLNEGVPLLYKGAELVTGGVKAVEVGVAVHSFHFLNLELDFSPGCFVVFVLEVGERDFKNATTQGIGGDFFNLKC